MKYLILLVFVLPISSFAQLTSENFQVDGYSVGSTQSTNASSENFETTRETGGIFELSTEVETDNGLVRNGTRVSPPEDVATGQGNESEKNDTVENGQGIGVESGESANGDLDVENIFGDADYSGATTSTGVGGSGVLETVNTDLEPDEDTFFDNKNQQEQNEIADDYVWIKYFWVWWFLLLILALYTARKLAYKNVDTLHRLK